MEMRQLMVELTDEELDAKGRDLARVTLDTKATEAALDQAASEYADEKKALNKNLVELAGRRNELASAIATRKASRDTPCDWYFDFDSATKYLVRRDSGDCVERRKLEEKEKQQAIGERLAEASAAQLDLWEQQLAGQPDVDLIDAEYVEEQAPPPPAGSVEIPLLDEADEAEDEDEEP